jgi:RNA polymerase sigma factor (sigma-70 family)
MPTDDRATDERIARKIRAEECDEEVEAWIRRFIRKALATARRWGHTDADAADFLQDFWVVLFRNRLKTYESTRQSLFSYCFAIFMNEFRRRGAVRARELRAAEEISPPVDSSGSGGVILASRERSSEEMIISDQERYALERSVNALETADRRLIQERFLKERSPADIARDLGVSEEAARVRIHRALNKLRQRHVASVNRIAN